MKERENSIKASVVNIKNYIVAMPTKKKFIFSGVALVIIVLAVLLTVSLNSKPPSEYQVLYAADSPEVAADLFLQLQGLGATPQLDGNNIMVKAAEYDACLIKMSTLGLQKDALAYGIFAQYSGLTSTESEKKQTLIYQLQDRMQDTLKSMTGVRNAIVTLVMPAESKNIWDNALAQDKTTASVMLEFDIGVSLVPEQVTAIKNLVASSVTKLNPADVTVVDSGTGMLLVGLAEEDTSGVSSSKNLDFQKEMEKHLQDRAVSILEPIIGVGGVTSQANVVLDYDKMIEESYDLVGQKDANGNDIGGRISHYEDTYGVNGQQSAAGLVGEDPNTDIPAYPFGTPTTDGGVTDFGHSADYVYGYIKTQVEKGQAALLSASISVVVNQELTAVQQQTYIDLISKSTGIDPQFISIAPNFIPPVPVVPPAASVPPVDVQNGNPIPIWVWLIIGGVLLLTVILVFILLLIRKKNKKIVEQKEAEIVDNLQTMEDEIAKYKRELEDAARSTTDPKDDAIMDEVRGFAKENPEITANLLRSWLKEEEE